MIILLVIHLFVTLALIGVILLQKSEGGGLGMGGGGGGSQGLFTARGTANLLTRVTAVLAAIFIGLCLVMTVVSKHQIKNASSILDAPTSSKKK
jgi:preprotein translocase subunit SecG